MKYYKLFEDMDRVGDIICFSDESNSFPLQLFCMGKKYSNENKSFCFFCDEEDGDIANILKVVDALCLERSEYFVTDIEGIGKIYSVVKYGIFAEKNR